MIIGVVGTLASGKDTVADYLESRGFVHFSTADEIRWLMHMKGLALDRDTMTAFTLAERTENGNDYFTKRVIEQFPSGEKNVVVTDMRHTDEILALRKLPDFILIGVDAPIDLRFARAKARQRIGDGETLEAFQAKEERELSGKLVSHNLGAVIALADYQITNNGTLEELQKKVETILRKIQSKN